MLMDKTEGLRNYIVGEERLTELRSFMRRSSWVRAEKKTAAKKIQSFSSLMKLSGPSSTHRKQNT